MAVELKYADSNLVAQKLSDASKSGKTIKKSQSVAVAVADDDGSVYGLAIVNSSDIPVDVDIQTTAITNGTDYDLGLYEVGNGAPGAVASKDILMNGQTMASASTVLKGMSAVAAADRGKAFWQLLGLTKDPQKQYVLALTANTVGSAAGTINVDFEIYPKG
jgi:hypothetical protein